LKRTGLSRWREIEAFQLKVSIGGGLWRLKGLPDGLRRVKPGHDMRTSHIQTPA
jgi:hypothetical protein